MTHKDKVERAIRELKAKGISPRGIAPPLVRALWAAGVEIPPLFFMSFPQLFFFAAVSFAALVGLFAWVAEWLGWLHFKPSAWIGFSFGGLLYGLAVAAHCRWKARRLGLHSWREYDEA
jgi:hypothetical protein